MSGARSLVKTIARHGRTSTRLTTRVVHNFNEALKSTADHDETFQTRRELGLAQHFIGDLVAARSTFEDMLRTEDQSADDNGLKATIMRDLGLAYADSAIRARVDIGDWIRSGSLQDKANAFLGESSKLTQEPGEILMNNAYVAMSNYLSSLNRGRQFRRTLSQIAKIMSELKVRDFALEYEVARLRLKCESVIGSIPVMIQIFEFARKANKKDELRQTFREITWPYVRVFKLKDMGGE